MKKTIAETIVSAHPFQFESAPGEFVIRIERGKEYLPLRCELSISEPEPPEDSRGQARTTVERTFPLQRWMNMAFPVTFWTTTSDRIPDVEPSPLRSQGPSPFGPREDRGYEFVWITDRNVILPRNTEYEIFSLGSRPHVLGAFIILNHRTVNDFEVDEQPVQPPRIQIDYLLEQLELSMEKQRGILSPEAFAEFEQAREAYRRIQTMASPGRSSQRRPGGRLLQCDR